MASEKDESFLLKLFPHLSDLFATPDEARDLQYWRERLVSFIFFVFSLFGFFAYIPSVYLAVRDEFWSIVLIDTIIYGLVLTIHFSKDVSFVFKTGFVLAATYIIGIGLLFSVDADYAINWFFSVPIIAAVLLGLKAAIVTLSTNVLFLILSGYVIHTGIAHWSNIEEDLVAGWFILSLSFMMLNSITALSISVLFEQLKRSLESATRANQGLYEERKNLVHEIQQRIQAEQEKDIANRKLQQSQKMEAIGMMAGGVAHDLNNILSGVINYPELMLLTLPDDSEYRKPLEAVIRSGNRAADMVSDLLTVSSGIASPKIPYSLNAIVKEYLDSPEASALRARYPAVTLITELDADVKNIFCSRIHIFKSIMNLVTNSAESIRDQGEVRIRTSSEFLDPGLPMAVENTRERFSILEVIDNGEGVSDSDLKRIFEPFYTRKVMGVSGTGLGLTIVWNTVQDHGGRIDVSSDGVAGTCFKLTFPVCSDDLRKPERIESVQDLAGAGERVLIVDDESEQREIASEILRSLNYSIVTAASGNAAIEYLQGSEVDLVMLDMLMPPSINGLETYREILKIHPGQKAIIVSGFSEDKDVKKARDLGVGDFLAKPYSREQLAKVIKKALLKSD